MENEPDKKEFLTAKELAEMLSVSRKFVIKNTMTHRMPGQVKIGRLWRYRLRDVEKRLLSGKLLLDRLN